MPRIPVHRRRILFDNAEDTENGVWICEVCGEDDEGGAVVYEVVRVTRLFPETRAMCLCSVCADRVSHGRVLSS